MMDITDEYILMCKKEEKIQKIGKEIPMLKGDDMFYHPTAHVVEIWCRWLNLKKDEDFLENLIWLPRQDQLQKIYMEEYEGGVDMWQAFSEWLFQNKKDDKYKQWNVIHYQYSGEQLWLAFVMEKRWNKVWDGGNWKERKNKMKNWRVTIDRKFCPYLLNGNCQHKKYGDEPDKDYKCSWDRCPVIRAFHDVDKFYKE